MVSYTKPVCLFTVLFSAALFCIDAWALSCFPRYSAQDVERYGAQHMEQYELQTREDIARYPLIAEGEVIALTSEACWDLFSARGATIQVTRYYRRPDDTNTDDRYLVTVESETFKVGDSVFFMAYPESESDYTARMVPRNKVKGEIYLGARRHMA